MADSYFGPLVDPSYYGSGANVAPVTYVGPQVNPSLYPGAVTGSAPQQQGGDLWSRLMNAVGNPGLGNMPKMPGTTIGAPAGSNQAPLQPPQLLPQYQMQAPRGSGSAAFLQSLPQVAGGGSNLMAQYMALQQLMRGS